MNRKQFFVAVFTALIGAKRWRKLFPVKLNFSREAFMNPAHLTYLSSSVGSLFNPSTDIHKLYLTGRIENIRWAYPKIGNTLNIKRPMRYADKFIA